MENFRTSQDASKLDPALFLLGTLELGGSEKKTVGLARRLKSKGYPVHVAYLRKPDPLRSGLGDVPVVHLCQEGKYSIRALRNLKNYIQQHGITSVVTVNLYPLLYAMPARRSLVNGQGNVFATVNTSEILSTKERLAMKIYARLLSLSTEIVFGSERQRSDWVRQYRLDPGRSRVIYNGVDGEYFDPGRTAGSHPTIRKSLGISDDAPVVVCVGKLRPEKGHLNLLRALSRLQEESGIEARLLIVGDGSERTAIEEESVRLGLSERVTMVGNVDDVRPYLGIADVFALPSIAVETFSNAALEAAAMGVPVVISDVGGAAEMFRDQPAARVYPRDDVSALANALQEIIVSQSGDVRTRTQLRDDILGRFSLASMDAQWTATIWRDRAEA